MNMREFLLSDRYFDAYIKAICDPHPLMEETFNREGEIISFLLSKCLEEHKLRTFLDIGCGNGRLLNTLDERYTKYFESWGYFGIDHNAKMIESLKNNLNNMKITNPHLRLNYDVKDIFDDVGTFDPKAYSIVNSSYNLIGSIDKDMRARLISQKASLTSETGFIVTSSWKQTAECTEFLKEYYPSIGCNIMHIDNEKTVLEDITFYRVSLDEMAELYFKNGFYDVRTYDIGPLWSIISGRKRD